MLDGVEVGWLGELHPRWQQKYELPQAVVLFEVDAASLEAAPLPRPSAPSRFPAAVRDIALLVDSDVAVRDVLEAIEAGKPAIAGEVSLFDLYQGPNIPPGKKSIAFRVVMQDTERTLTDSEADAVRDALVALLGRRFGASLR